MPARERPGALELLQREPERFVLQARVDAGDVRVQVEMVAVLTEEGDRDAYELGLAEGAGDEVAGMRERTEQRGGCLRVLVAPDVADEARGGLELGDGVEQPDFHAGPVRCRQRRRGRIGGELRQVLARCGLQIGHPLSMVPCVSPLRHRWPEQHLRSKLVRSSECPVLRNHGECAQCRCLPNWSTHSPSACPRWSRRSKRS